MMVLPTQYNKRASNKNNAIAFANRRIPYLPELRAYCQSVTACLLMTQLEYRFSGMPEGFYKFLSPCDNELYRQGDSWVEELHFSETEFRNAFDNIGVRYRSKKQLDELIQTGADPFQGKAYLSYIDVRGGLTYYLRNHELVSLVVDDALQTYQPIMSQPSPDSLSAPEPIKLNLQRLTNLSSGDQITASPYIEEHKKTTQEDTAAESGLSNQVPSEPEPSLFSSTQQQPLAAAFLSDSDLLIADSLTAKQTEQVHQVAQELQRAGYLVGMNEISAHQAITDTLLSPHTYTKAHIDFCLKLNTIKKAIKQGRWSPPVDKYVQQQVQEKKEEDALTQAINLALSDVQHAKKMLAYSREHSWQLTWGDSLSQAEEAYQALIVKQKKLTAKKGLDPSAQAVGRLCVA